MNYSWQCPFCSHHSTLSLLDYSVFEEALSIDNSDGGAKILAGIFTVCPNVKCKKISLNVSLWSAILSRYTNRKINLLKKWQLIPSSGAKVFPSYVPKPIIEDYEEACLIMNSSPKASATLARRCLQGMVRDFYKVSGSTLYQEIDLIKDKVDPLTWQAIDAVRKIGKYGAHMEKDINLIVDVQPEEAKKLIDLIEVLIREWYINRQERQKNLESLIKIANDKDQLGKDGKK